MDLLIAFSWSHGNRSGISNEIISWPSENGPITKESIGRIRNMIIKSNKGSITDNVDAIITITPLPIKLEFKS